MTPTHTRKRGRLYRYYVATSAIRSGAPDRQPDPAHSGSRDRGRRHRSDQAAGPVARDRRRDLAGSEDSTSRGLTERQVREHLHGFTEVWAELFPAEQARIVQLLVARVDVTPRALTSRSEPMAWRR